MSRYGKRKKDERGLKKNERRLKKVSKKVLSMEKLLKKVLTTHEKKERSKKAVTDSTEVVEKTLYLRMNTSTTYDSREIEWYRVNFSSDDKDYDSDNNYDPERKRRRKKREEKQKQPTPIDPISKTSIPWLNCHCVALGSTIYAMVRGSYICSVEAGNLSTARRHWKVHTTIHPSRNLYTQVVALDGKIYLFGASLNTYRPNCRRNFTVAVFAPVKNRLEDTISQPPLQFPPVEKGGFFSVADPSNQRIILGSLYSGVLLAYYVRNYSWEILNPQFHDKLATILSRTVLFDNTLYWIWLGGGYDGIFAYDLDKKTTMNGDIIHLPYNFYDNPDFAPLFFHFCGDEFYLIWFGCDYEDDDSLVEDDHTPFLLRCVRLRVSWAAHKLRAYTLSEKTYLLNRESVVMDGVVL